MYGGAAQQQKDMFFNINYSIDLLTAPTHTRYHGDGSDGGLGVKSLLVSVQYKEEFQP